MKILIELGGIRFRFDSDCDIMVEETFAPFFCTTKNVSDVNVEVIHDFSQAPMPVTPMIGEDLLLEYYREDGRLCCLTKGGRGRYLACCTWEEGSSELRCWVDLPAETVDSSLGNLLRMIPLRRILLQRGVLFLHASQIAAGERSILFTAPSGTGKTTQAKLWQQCRGARILCNDRTLTDGVRTYGFPVDGSEPVGSGEAGTLGAIAVLEQAPENTVRRLRARDALIRLMPQLVMDTWDPDSRAGAMELLLELISRIPVYLLGCTPDEGAVRCLEQQLWKDGVMLHE